MRVARLRNRIIDLQFTDKYLAGKDMPCDFASRHPRPISELSEHEREDLMVDDGEDVQVMKVMMARTMATVMSLL